MILYRTTAYMGDAPFDCSRMPSGATPFWVWAVGGGELVAPNNTAFVASQYFALQIHYNNPTFRNDVWDSSGVRVSFSPVLAPQPSYFLIVGVSTPAISLPPNGTVHISYTCGGGAGITLIPPGASVRMWGAGLHAHTRARKIWVELWRSGSIVAYPGCSLFYDFNTQSLELRNVTIVRGDQLRVHCQYDTTAETQTVTGGESTTQEMCLAFLSIYGEGITVPSDIPCVGAPTYLPPVGNTRFCT